MQTRKLSELREKWIGGTSIITHNAKLSRKT